MKKNLEIIDFDLNRLKVVKDFLEKSLSYEEALYNINSIIAAKEAVLASSLNAQTSVAFYNIDLHNIDILLNAGVYTIADLRALTVDEVRSLPGMTKAGLKQILWARDFFDLDAVVERVRKSREAEKHK